MTEQWKPIPGYDGLYEVSSQGRVRTLHPRGNRVGHRGGSFPHSEDGCLSLVHSEDGYLLCTLYDQRSHARLRRVHALVLQAFVGPRPKGFVAGHRNAKRDDNRVENLAWITHDDNVRQREADGNTARGASHGAAKLSEAQVKEIRDRRGHESQAQLAKRFGVSPALISFIHARRIWRHI